MDKFLVKSVLMVFAILTVFAGAYVVVEKRKEATRDFNIQFVVPQRIAAGDTVSYNVMYENDTKNELRDVDFTIEYPKGAMVQNGPQDFEEISSQTKREERIEAGKKGEVAFETLLFGALGDTRDITIRIEYRKENSNAVSRIEKEAKIEISSLPLALKFTFPSKVNLGEEMEFTLTYFSTSSNAFPFLQLAVTYPDTFRFLGADPPSSQDDSSWDIGILSPQASGEIKIRGVFAGEAGKEHVFIAELGSKAGEAFTLFSSQERKVIASLPSFFLTQSLGGTRTSVVKPGGTYEWEIGYRNMSGEILEHLEILVFFEGEGFDFSSLEPRGGVFLSSQKALRWDENTGEELTLLEPREEGRLGFAISLKNTLPIKESDDKNFTIRTRVAARVRGVTLAEDMQEFKIASRFELYQRGFWSTGPFDNSGPLPPRVGEKTTYTISWQIFNSSNELSGVVVRGAIPSFATWEGQVVPANEDITFNTTTGEIIWNIGNLKNGIGVVLPVRQVSFQIGIIPSESDSGKVLELIGGANAVGRDTFTGVWLESFSSALDSTLPDDPTVSE